MQKELLRKCLHSFSPIYRFKSSQKLPAERQQQHAVKLTKKQIDDKEFNKPSNEINWQRMKESYKSYIMGGESKLYDLKKNTNWNRFFTKFIHKILYLVLFFVKLFSNLLI